MKHEIVADGQTEEAVKDGWDHETIYKGVTNNGWEYKVTYRKSEPKLKKDRAHCSNRFLRLEAFTDPNPTSDFEEPLEAVAKAVEKTAEDQAPGKYENFKAIIPRLKIYSLLDEKTYFERKWSWKDFGYINMPFDSEIRFDNSINVDNQCPVFPDYWYNIPFSFVYKFDDKTGEEKFWSPNCDSGGASNFFVGKPGKTIDKIVKDFEAEREFSILALNNATHSFDLSEYNIGHTRRSDPDYTEIWGYAKEKTGIDCSCRGNYDIERDAKFTDYQSIVIVSQIHRIGKRFGVPGETIYELIENISPEFKGFIHPAIFSRQVAEQLRNEELKKHVLGENYS